MKHHAVRDRECLNVEVSKNTKRQWMTLKKKRQGAKTPLSARAPKLENGD